jgi:hemolysin III
MTDNLTTSNATHHHRPFSISRFSILVAAQLVVLFVGYRVLIPRLWERQLAGGFVPFLAVFLAVHLLLCFFEWFFHRYVLHSVAIPLLKGFAVDHRHHHSLTSIRLRPVEQGSDRVILSEYPITEDTQHESSAFPAYALVAFWALFTPLLLGAQFLLPSMPVLLGGYAAIAWSMMLYEILHAIDHWPYEWWCRATEHPRFGGFWRVIYGFHLMHHANIGCNEGIGGFFGLPVADWCFGTHHQPERLLLHGRKATAKDFAVRLPRRFIRRLDQWARARESRLRGSA